jgi:hypothetical protein
VLILSQMSLALVILVCLSTVCAIPPSSLQAPELTPTLPCRVSPDRVEAQRTKAISGRLACITVLTQVKYVL